MTASFPHTCDAASGPFVGHQQTFDGGIAVLRNCTCGSTRTVAVIEDASLCRGCKAVVTGRMGDPKVVVQHADGGVYCVRCAPRLQYVDDMIEDGRALRRLLAAGSHLHMPSVRAPMLRDEDSLESAGAL